MVFHVLDLGFLIPSALGDQSSFQHFAVTSHLFSTASLYPSMGQIWPWDGGCPLHVPPTTFQVIHVVPRPHRPSIPDVV